MIASRGLTAAMIVAMVALVAAPVAHAQQRTSPKAASAKQQGKSGDSGDAQMRSRIEQLEEQLADMQVMIGTLESLGRGGNAGPAARAGGGGVDQARLDSLETQIRALASQLQQLSTEIRQLQGSRRGDIGSPSVVGTFGAPPQVPAAPTAQPSLPEPPRGSVIPGFGSTTVTPGGNDPIGQLIRPEAPQNASASPGRAPLPPSANSGNPRELYETAYGYLLQQDYGAAEVAFDEFLRRYPKDRLAADAQYWLGETLYVQRRYKPAGRAFLNVIENHKTSAKVPNSLLKLAQSLEQIGQKDCGIFVELEQRHANAPADVKVKAQALKRRQGC